jgi:hypothetical protein
VNDEIAFASPGAANEQALDVVVTYPDRTVVALTGGVHLMRGVLSM